MISLKQLVFEIVGVAAGAVLALLLIFTLRRLVLIVAAALPRDDEPDCAAVPYVAVIVAVRDEEASLPGLLEALGGLCYPSEKLQFILVDDNSADHTAEVLESWAAAHSRARVIRLPERAGKAAALNRGLEAVTGAELVAVYDADLRPHPGSLLHLVSQFSDRRIAAVGGYRQPSNAAANSISAYAALESFVHQLVTQAGKEKLRLNPTTLGGNCVYRTGPLREIGGFPAGAFSEDVEVSLALVQGGWGTRFCRAAVADATVPQSLPRYWNQRARWTRGVYHAGRKASGLESWLVAAGYLDRVVFVAAVALAAAGVLHPAWLGAYLVAPAAACGTALLKSHAGLGTCLRICCWAVPMFLLDVVATMSASTSALLRRPLDWYTGGVSARGGSGHAPGEGMRRAHPRTKA